MARATLAPIATPWGKSSKLTGGRKMGLMLGGRPPRTAFMALSRGPDAGMMYVTRKLWSRTSFLASTRDEVSHPRAWDNGYTGCLFHGNSIVLEIKERGVKGKVEWNICGLGEYNHIYSLFI